jgi:hypothetical protein
MHFIADAMSGLDSQLHLHHPAKLSAYTAADPTAALLTRNRVASAAAVANRPAVPLPVGSNNSQSVVRVSAHDATNSQLLISRALTSSLSSGSGNKTVLSGSGLQYSAAAGQQEPKMSALIEPQLAGQQLMMSAASSQQQQRYQELLSQRLLGGGGGGGGQIVRLTAGSSSDFGAAAGQPTRPMSAVQASMGSGGEIGAYSRTAAAGGAVMGGMVQTLPRSQGIMSHHQQQQPQIHQEFTHQECFLNPPNR